MCIIALLLYWTLHSLILGFHLIWPTIIPRSLMALPTVRLQGSRPSRDELRRSDADRRRPLTVADIGCLKNKLTTLTNWPLDRNLQLYTYPARLSRAIIPQIVSSNFSNSTYRRYQLDSASST